MQRIYLDIRFALANQHQKDDFNKLVDGDPKTIYTAWNPFFKPYAISFPLLNYSKCVIQQLKAFINNGNPSTQKYYIIRRDTGEKVLIYSYPGGTWSADPTFNPLRTFDIPANLQFDASEFIIESKGNDDFPANLELYGDAIEGTAVLPSITRSPLSQLMGVVVKPWDISNNMFPEKIPLLVESGIKRVRLYSDYELIFNKTTNALDLSAGMWHMMDNIKLLKSKGISTQLCYLSFPYFPYATANQLNVETYLQLAKDVTFIAQANKDNGDPIDWIEIGNEINQWYNGNPDANMSGYALAALMSMCYDGHNGKYPVGIKGTGTKALVSAPGLAEQEPYIFKQMIEWSIANRGLNADGSPNVPFDVYSFHNYSSLEGQRSDVPGGTPPEIGMFPFMRKANVIRKQSTPKTKIHIGEWGWDINAGSPLNAPAFGQYSAHQVSAMWTSRAILAMAENEIDACSYYRIKEDYDVGGLSDNNATQFETMALVRQENEGTKQPDGSYIGFGMHRTLTGDYLKQLSEFLNAGFVFDSRLSGSVDSNIDAPHVLKFKKDGIELYVIWQHESMVIATRPQLTERTGTYTLNVNGKVRRFVDDGSGVMSSEDFAGGFIAFGSKPVIVLADAVIDPAPQPDPVPTKVIVDKGYYTASGKRVYWVMYDNGTWVKTNYKYQPF